MEKLIQYLQLQLLKILTNLILSHEKKTSFIGNRISPQLVHSKDIMHWSNGAVRFFVCFF